MAYFESDIAQPAKDLPGGEPPPGLLRPAQGGRSQTCDQQLGRDSKLEISGFQTFCIIETVLFVMWVCAEPVDIMRRLRLRGCSCKTETCGAAGADFCTLEACLLINNFFLKLGT